MTSDWQITEVATGIHFVEGPASNWVILINDDATALIDCGYPGDWSALTASLAAAGKHPDDVDHLLVTHAHSDHIGSAERLRRDHGTEVIACGPEAQHARRTVLHQVTKAEVEAQGVDPLVRAWMDHAIAAGGLGDVAVAEVTEVPPGAAVAAAHRPIPHLLPGHTPGHTVYELPQAQVIVVGDGLVSGHAISKHQGPQMLHPMFHTDPLMAERSLERLAALPGKVVLPGHGPAMQCSPEEAVAAVHRTRALTGSPRRYSSPTPDEQQTAQSAAAHHGSCATKEVAEVLREWLSSAGVPCEARGRVLQEFACRQASGSRWSSAS